MALSPFQTTLSCALRGNMRNVDFTLKNC